MVGLLGWYCFVVCCDFTGCLLVGLLGVVCVGFAFD